MPCSYTAMKNTFASITVAITVILGAMSTAQAGVIGSGADASDGAAFDMSAVALDDIPSPASGSDEEFQHFHFDGLGGLGGLTKVAVQQLGTRADGIALEQPDGTVGPAGEAPEPGVIVLVALGLAAIIRIRRRQEA